LSDYRRQIKQYIVPFFGKRQRLTELSPSRVAQFVAWLASEDQQQRVLADGTIRNICAPLRACLGTAVREGVIRSNPAVSIDLPNREGIVDDEDDVRALTSEQLDTFLRVVHADWRTFFHLLAVTGLRISEAIGLEWRHVHLDGSDPHVKIRQRMVRGRMGPPKSRRGRRDVPLPHSLVIELRQLRASTNYPEADQPVFASTRGTVLRPNNVWARILKPAAQEAGVPDIGFHSFRHTCAALLISEGRNIVQISRFLGHASPAFTLTRYGGLMNDDMGGGIDLAVPALGRRLDATDGLSDSPVPSGPSVILTV
jgi:integrase